MFGSLKLAFRRILGISMLEDRMRQLLIETRLSVAFSRAAATGAIREIDPQNPLSWQFSGFSQHGEDGIVDYLTTRIKHPNKFFVEIGAADGLENCSAWLAFTKSYAGIMIEGNALLSEQCRKALRGRIWNVHSINSMVSIENIHETMKLCPFLDPDVFILDIDGIDFHIMKRVLELGYRPKIIVVEYNSAFGPEKAITIPYKPMFSRWEAHPSGLFYGVSINAWHKLLSQFGYTFLSVESSGTNAFYVKESDFPKDLFLLTKGTAFLNNNSDGCGVAITGSASSGKPPLRDWKTQFDHFKDLNFISV